MAGKVHQCFGGILPKGIGKRGSMYWRTCLHKVAENWSAGSTRDLLCHYATILPVSTTFIQTDCHLLLTFFEDLPGYPSILNRPVITNDARPHLVHDVRKGDTSMQITDGEATTPSGPETHSLLRQVIKSLG
jgi:hypothetical protein